MITYFFSVSIITKYSVCRGQNKTSLNKMNQLSEGIKLGRWWIFKHVSFSKSPYFKFAWVCCRFSPSTAILWQNPELGAVMDTTNNGTHLKCLLWAHSYLVVLKYYCHQLFTNARQKWYQFQWIKELIFCSTLQKKKKWHISFTLYVDGLKCVFLNKTFPS